MDESTGRSFRPRRGQLALLALACGLLAAVCAIALRSPFWVVVAIGATGLVLFVAATGVLLWRAVRPGPTVVVDARGITDRTTLAPTGLIRWEEITAIRKREIGRGVGAERMLEIMLTDPAGFRARPRTRLRRLSDAYRAALKQPAVSIPGAMVAAPMQALVDEIQRQRPQLVVLELPPPPPRLFRRRGGADSRHPQLPRW